MNVRDTLEIRQLVEYFDQLSGDARTRKLVKTLKIAKGETQSQTIGVILVKLLGSDSLF